MREQWGESWSAEYNGCSARSTSFSDLERITPIRSDNCKQQTAFVADYADWIGYCKKQTAFVADLHGNGRILQLQNSLTTDFTDTADKAKDSLKERQLRKSFAVSA
ncbi:MAG TPA: hypothetical protein VGQ30_05170, partial [Gemmatimonadaceae bacterium]|nr:hypothetical protein [Gemmatimonadaceae bacterium]